MWLTVLLSALDEAASEEGRRASTHEVARRLGVPWRREGDGGSAASVPAAPPLRFASTQEAFLSILPEVISRETAIAFHYLAGRLGSWEPERKVVDLRPEDVGVNPESGLFPFRIPTRFSARTSDALVPWLFREISAWLDWNSVEPEDGMETWEGRNLYKLQRVFLQKLSLFFDWVSGTHPDLSLYTIDSAIHAAVAWHDTLANVRSKNAPRPGVVVAQFADGARIERLVSRPELNEEGKTMGHCIGSHADALLTGSRFFSYRKANGMPSASMEITGLYGERGLGTTLLELKGEENEEVEGGLVRRRIEAWLESAGIQIGNDADKVGAEASFSLVLPVLFWPEAERPELETEADQELDKKLSFNHLSRGHKIAKNLASLTVFLDKLSGAENLSQDATGLLLLEQERDALGRDRDVKAQTAAIHRIRRDLDSRMGLSAEQAETLTPGDLRDLADEQMSHSIEGSAASKAYTLLRSISERMSGALGKSMVVSRGRDNRETSFHLATIEIDPSTSAAESACVYDIDVLVSAEYPIFRLISRDLYDDDEHELGDYPTLLSALQGASLIETVAQRRKKMEGAEARLNEIGLSAKLPFAIAHHANIPTFLAGAREAGFTIPKAIERRFKDAEWVSEVEPG